MSSVDWKVKAPKRADWMRLNALCEKKGIPKPCWVNGIPTGLSEKEMVVLESLLFEPAPIEQTYPEPPKKKGWPKGKPRK